MADTKPEAKAKATPKVTPKVEEEYIPSHDELLLENYTKMGFVLVKWVGSKTVSKLAPSPTGIVRELGETSYGLTGPGQYLLVHKNDARDKRFYHRLTAKEKPKKSEVQLHIGGRKSLFVRVTWPGMPKDPLDRFNRRPLP